MKNKLFTIIFLATTLFVIPEAKAQFKIHSTGRVSFQSATTTGGVQIYTNGVASFEPGITTSGTSLNQTKVQSNLVRAWTVRYSGNPMVLPEFRFYVTGLGDAYAHNHYTIGSGGGDEPNKGSYPIEDPMGLIGSLNGYYYDNHDFDGFEPDFIDNPNIAPEAVEGMLKDLEIDKSLGLSVEDLEAVLPEAIRHDPEGKVYINYSAVIPVLVEAFKEQQARIELLEAILKENGQMKP